MKQEWLNTYKKEVEIFILVLAILTAIFSYPDKDILSTFLITLLILTINIFFTKRAMSMYGRTANLRIWTLKRWGLRSHHTTKFEFPAGAVFPILFSILTGGFLIFPLVSMFRLKDTHRAGKFRPHILEWEEAKGLFLGLLPLIILIPFFYVLEMELAVWVTALYVLGQLIPMPGSTGIKIVFASKAFYVFTMALFLSILLLLGIMNYFLIIILALLFSVIVSIFYYHSTF